MRKTEQVTAKTQNRRPGAIMAAIRHGLKMDLNKAARPFAKAAVWQPIQNRHQSSMAGFGADPKKLEIAITSSILCKAYLKDI